MTTKKTSDFRVMKVDDTGVLTGQLDHEAVRSVRGARKAIETCGDTGETYAIVKVIQVIGEVASVRIEPGILADTVVVLFSDGSSATGTLNSVEE